MSRIDMLSQFPFTFFMEPLAQNHSFSIRCYFLQSMKRHQKGLWKPECMCGPEVASIESLSNAAEGNLESSICPCKEPENLFPISLSSWEDYYHWRSLPLDHPLQLYFIGHPSNNGVHPRYGETGNEISRQQRAVGYCSPCTVTIYSQPLTLYHCLQLSHYQTSRSSLDTLCIHYLGPEKEQLQLAVFGELHALFPDVHVHIELLGPAVPKSRDGEVVSISRYAHCSDESCCCKSYTGSEDLSCSAVTLKLWKGFYHERYSDIMKDSNPHLIFAPNAGVAAYPSWMPTIELIRGTGIPAIFTDFCEEAAHLASCCITSITRQPLRVQVQVNPFRQPIAVDNNALFVPCYSNCFALGM